jgi:formate--tetrahydrofolate ligase
MLKGAANLQKHIETVQAFQVPFVVAINKFASDTEAEVNALLKWCSDLGYPAELSDGWANGGKGMEDLASRVAKIIDTQESRYAPIYDVNDTIQNKIEIISKTVYGADGVEYSEEALEKIKIFISNGWDRMPICMAKTPLSLTDDPKIQGRPEGFSIHVSDLSVSRGAGFIVAYTGSILTMPGLPKVPAAVNMGVDENGNSYGIF